MSDLDFTEIPKTIPCHKCGANAGESCRTGSGAVARFLHSARTVPIYDAYGAGYQLGFREARERYTTPVRA